MSQTTMRRVVACRPTPNFGVWLRFDDGLVGTVHLHGVLELSIFRALREERVFRTVCVDTQTGAVRWPAADVYLHASTLYDDIAARGGQRISAPSEDPRFQRFLASAIGGPRGKRKRASRRMDGEHGEA